MTHYSNNPNMVRVDYFKPGGKWYMTEAVDMDAVYDFTDIHEGVMSAMVMHWTKTREEARRWSWRQFTIVVLEPYHQNAYPIMIKAEEKD